MARPGQGRDAPRVGLDERARATGPHFQPGALVRDGLVRTGALHSSDVSWHGGQTTARSGEQEYYFAPDLPKASADPRDAFLLPPFDEFLVAYRDRSAALDPQYNNLIVPGGKPPIELRRTNEITAL